MGRSPLFLLALLPGCLWISRDDHRLRTDMDGDGVPHDDDCDDRDPLVYPSNAEDPCDGRDNDCNPLTADGPAAIGSTTYDSMQGALDAASAGDTVILCPGTHAGAITLSRAVTVTGSISPDDTVIDATGTGAPAVTVIGGGATLRKLTLTGGTGAPNPRTDLVDAATIGGGLLAIDAVGTVLLEDVVVRDNAADAGGGVFAPTAASLELLRAVVRDNTATGLGGALVIPFAATLNATTVSANTAGVGGGGVVVLPGASGLAVGATVVRDNAAPSGGGLWLLGTWNGGTISENVAAARGGGVWLEGGTLAGAVVERNTGAEGGGFAGAGVLEDAAVDDNTATHGGGVFVTGDLDLRGAVSVSGNAAEGGDGGGLKVVAGTLSWGSQEIEVLDNQAYDGLGGGIAATGGSLDLLFGRVSDNFASNGAGIAIDTEPSCATCTYDLTTVGVRSNTASAAGGGVWTDAAARISDCELEGNIAGTSGGGVYVAEGGVADIGGGTVAANTAGQYGGGLAVFSTALATSLQASTLVQANSAIDGAAIRIGPSGSVTCSATEFRDNTTVVGAAVSLEQGAGGVETTFDSVGQTSWVGNDTSDVNAGVYTYDATQASFTCVWGASPAGSCSQ